NSRWFALGSAVFSHVWKWTPFWTVILLAGRMSIPQEIYDAAKVDGATGLKRFLYVTFPLLANLYLVLTLLATIFLLGDFNSVYFVTGGGPANSTHLLATLGIRDAFDLAQPRLGVAAVMSALPLMIPLYNMLMVSLEAEGDVFSDHLFPPNPSAHSFWIVLSQGFWYLEFFWHQFGNSCYIAFMVTLLVLLIGSLTSFSVGRMRIRN